MTSVNTSTGHPAAQPTDPIPPDLVKAVAERVYALLRRELIIERERHGACGEQRPQFRGGG